MARRKQPKKRPTTFTFGSVAYQDKTVENKSVKSLQTTTCVEFEKNKRIKDEAPISNLYVEAKLRKTKTTIKKFKIEAEKPKQIILGQTIRMRRAAVEAMREFDKFEGDEQKIFIRETYNAGIRDNSADTGLNVSRISGKQKDRGESKTLIKSTRKEDRKVLSKKVAKQFKKALRAVK